MKPAPGQNVCAVVVTWHIKEKYIPNFTATVHQVAQVVIVDNASDPCTILVLRSLQSRYPDKVTIIYNSVNKGIGAAQNQGVDMALKRGFEWILLLDHDSCPAPDMVNNLLAAYDTILHSAEAKNLRAGEDHKNFCRKKIGLLAPNIIEQNFPREMKLLVFGFGSFWRRFKQDSIVHDVRSVIASGSLIRKEVFGDLGGFDETFFMDYVDVEFCLRMYEKKWEIVAVRDAALVHNLGTITEQTFLGHNVSASNHNASRRFTMFNNRAIVWRRFFFSQPGYVLFDMGMAVYELVKIILFEPYPFPKIQAALKGLVQKKTT